MNDTGYYTVVVKIEEEVGYSKTKDEPIVKKHSENYVVKAGSTQQASEKVEKYMEPCSLEWRINSVKELNIIDIID